MPNLTWITEQRKLADLADWDRNPRQLSKHDADELAASLHKFNLADPLVVNQDGRIIGGHQRKRVLLSNGYKLDDLVDVRVPSRPLTDEEAAELAIRLNRNQGEWDMDILANQFDVDDLMDWGFTAFDFQIDDWGVEDAELEEDEPELESELSRWDVPDAIWPTDNEWGVPLLDANLQANAVVVPWSCWGSVSRKTRMSGTWHFYTEDYRYMALWNDPSPIVNTRCTAIVEPNFSCYLEMPLAVGLWRIYMKRWLARWWQSYGIRVFVDLNVARPFAELNLLGVPEGWKAYATRGYTDRLDGTEREYMLACERAGTDSILFVVYGGGKAVQERCQERGWVWFGEVMDEKQ